MSTNTSRTESQQPYMQILDKALNICKAALPANIRQGNKYIQRPKGQQPYLQISDKAMNVCKDQKASSITCKH
jgi:hypothetical protein